MSSNKKVVSSKFTEKDLVQFFYFLKEYGPKWKEIQKHLKELRNNKDFGSLPSADSKDLFTFINEYYEQSEANKKGNNNSSENNAGNIEK